MSSLRRWLAALCAGMLLSLARLPLPLGVSDALAPSALLGGALPALACVCAAFALRPLVGRMSASAWLFGLATGFALHALWLESLRLAAVPLPPLLSLALLPLLVLAIAGLASTPGDAPPGAAEGAAKPERGSALEALGLALAGAGLFLALDQVQRSARLLGLATSADTGVMASVLLFATAFGALAFGRSLAGQARERAVLAGGLALAPAACMLGQRYLAGLGEAGAFLAYLKRFGLDSTRVGSLEVDALVAGSAFVAPAFALGTALCGLGEGRRLVWLALGALAGCAANLWLRGTTDRALDLAQALAAHQVEQRIGLACALGSLGALFVLWGRPPSASALASGSRLTAGSLAIICMAAPWAVGVPNALLFAPWQRVEVEAQLVIDARAGMFTVEAGPDSVAIATLDRVRLTPNAREEEGERRRLRMSLAALGRPASELRVLLIGQMCPARQRMLDELGLADWRWTAPWSEWAQPLSDALHGGLDPAPERWIAPAELANAAHFDLAIAQPLGGPLLSNLAPSRAPAAAAEVPAWPARLGAELPTVLWLDLGAALAPAGLGERVILSMTDVEQISVGLLLGPGWPEQAPASSPAWLRGGGARAPSTPFARLTTFPRLRAGLERARTLRALADANADARGAALLDGLAQIAALQRESSPWESDEQRIELDAASVERLASGSLGRRLDPFERELWIELARILVGKRMPDLVLRCIEPLVEANRPFLELDRALAHAYLEFDMPEKAAPLLESALQGSPYDLAAILEAAAAAGAARDHAKEAELLKRALALQPGRADVERRLGIALVRLGDPAGRPLVEAALARDPEDHELEPFLGPGPYPEVERGFQPGPSEPEHEHEH